MQKLKFLPLFIIAFVLIACGETNQQPNNDHKNDMLENEQEETLEDFHNNDYDQENKDDDEEKEDVEKESEETIEAKYRINANWSVEPIDDANEKVVLLTIDDAPDTYALEMAETLKKLEAHAIFFVNGHFIETEEKKEILKEIHEMGFVIGNHTYSHDNLNDLSKEEQKDEIVRVNDMVEEIIGERPKFFRAPFGVYTDYAKEIIAKENMVHMNWSYGYDWNKEYMNEEAIIDIMVNAPELNNGANLLMHDREWTAAGLHDIVTGLRDKGYEIVDPKLIETNGSK